MEPSRVFVLYRSGGDHTHIVGVYASPEDARREADRLHGEPLDWHPYAHTGLRADLPLGSAWSGYYVEPTELIPHAAPTGSRFPE